MLLLESFPEPRTDTLASVRGLLRYTQPPCKPASAGSTKAPAAKADAAPLSKPGALLERRCKDMGTLNTFSDITFFVEGGEIQAHKCILVARSEYFRRMLLLPLKEGAQSDGPTTVRISDFSFETILSMLTFLYSGTLRDLSSKSLLERIKLLKSLLVCSDKYQMNDLRILTERKLRICITMETATSIWRAAQLACCSRLSAYCLRFIADHYDEMRKESSFAEIISEDAKFVTQLMLLLVSPTDSRSACIKRSRSWNVTVGAPARFRDRL